MQKMYKKIILSLLFLFSFSQAVSAEAVIASDVVTSVKARVVEVLSEEKNQVEGTEINFFVQYLRVTPIEGDMKGQVLEVRNDYLPLQEGDTFFLNKLIEGDTGKQSLTVGDFYRVPQMMFFVFMFVGVVLLFGGKQGLRGLLSLIGSLLVIMYLLLPGVMNGFSPIWLSILCSSIIIVIGSFVTHGFTKTTLSAVIGMIVTVLLTGALAWFAVHFVALSGFESEDSIYLNFNTGGHIDFQGLLLGGIIIGLLGVLYDAAIGQSVAVEELYRASERMSPRRVYLRALRIGREHIGALVNTLAIAYVGASLPLLLLFFGSSLPLESIVNKEQFAAEVVRTMVGSIGLVLAVPITTLISVMMLKSFRGKGVDMDSEHHHGHSHAHFH